MGKRRRLFRGGKLIRIEIIVDGGSVEVVVDEVLRAFVLEGLEQFQRPRIVLIAFLDDHDIGVVIGGIGLRALVCDSASKFVLHRIISVDDTEIEVLQLDGTGNALSLQFHNLDIVGILEDVSLGGRQSDAFLEGNDTLGLQKRQGPSFVRRIVGDTDLCFIRNIG